MSDAAGAAEIVFGGYTQAELDGQYNQRTLVPDSELYSARWAEAGRRARAELDCALDVSYGPSPDETVDVFPAGEGAPLVLYFHGGAWTRRSKLDASYIAPPMVANGITFVAVDFTLAPAATLDEMVRQCRASVAWAKGNAARFGADPDQLFVLGHSSGGHLAGMIAVTDWPAEHGLPANTVKGISALSGIHDLEPVRLTHRNEYLRLDAGSVARNSAIRSIPSGAPPLIVGYGDRELDEFQRQSREFAAGWRAKGNECKEIVLAGRNHFDVGDDLADHASPVFRALMDLIGGGKAP